MANEVVSPLRRSDEVQPAANTALSNVVQQVLTGLQQAVSDMKADDVQVELSTFQERNRSQSRLSIRCYRRGQQIFGEERSE
jgi:hypothetical protein